MNGWIDVNERLPEKTGRYLTLVTFKNLCICNDAIVRKHMPFAGNFNIKEGWMSKIEEQEVTHWMEIPAYHDEE